MPLSQQNVMYIYNKYIIVFYFSWNTVYDQELNNFQETGNVGEPWYGFESETRIVNWIQKNGFSPLTNILDMGCGNASLLIVLVVYII